MNSSNIGTAGMAPGGYPAGNARFDGTTSGFRTKSRKTPTRPSSAEGATSLSSSEHPGGVHTGPCCKKCRSCRGCGLAPPFLDARAHATANPVVFDPLPTCQQDAVPLGNGLTGTMIWQNVPGEIEFVICRADVYSRSRDIFQHRKPIGACRLRFNGPIRRGSARPFSRRSVSGSCH